MNGKKRFIRNDATMLYGMPSELQHEIFKAYLSRTDKIVIVHDSHFLVRMVNTYGCQTLGVKENETTGIDWLNRFVHKDEQTPFRNEIAKLLNRLSIGPYSNECKLTTVHGIRTFSWQHFVVRRSPGLAQAFLSVGEDITPKKEMQAMLARRNAILKALSLAAEYFLTATSVTWERNVIEVLAAIGKARGSERVYACKNRPGNLGEAALSLKYEWKNTGEWHVFHAQEAPWMSYASVGLDRWAETFRKHGVINEQVDNLSESERQWNIAPQAQSVVAVPVFIDEDWWGYLAFEDWQEGKRATPEEIEALTALSITLGAAIRRKRTEEALANEKLFVEKRVVERTQEVKQEKARLAASIHSLSLGFVLTDLAGTVVLYNHAVNTILTRSETGWTAPALALCLNGVVDFTETVEQCIRKQQEIKLHDLAYQDKFITLSFTPIKMMEDQGQVIGVVVLIEDVTEAKKLQLSRDEFFAVAAHELRTPLSAISGNASIILDYFGDKVEKTEIAEMVQEIAKSSKRLTTIVNEYLDISRLELNKIEIKPERFDVGEVIREVVTDLKNQAEKKGLRLIFEDAAYELWAYADVGRTEQALVNIVGNAIKYTEQGSITITGSCVNNRIVIRIKDTGKGIKPDDQGQLFQKFKQVGDRVYARDVSQGTGMGLYITRLLTEAMRGNVYLEKSTLEDGSSFIIELPVG